MIMIYNILVDIILPFYQIVWLYKAYMYINNMLCIHIGCDMVAHVYNIFFAC